jgi:hypothetical protein
LREVLVERDILAEARSSGYFAGSAAARPRWHRRLSARGIAMLIGLPLMMSAGSQMRMPLVFAGLIVISVMAMAMYELFAVPERRTTGWATRGMDARG